MNTLLFVMCIALTLVSAWLYWQVRAQRTMILQAERESDGPDHAFDPEPVITLRVLDPIAIARRESKSARLLADRLPFAVKKMVYQEVMKELKKELEEREIAVVMQIEYR